MRNFTHEVRDRWLLPALVTLSLVAGGALTYAGFTLGSEAGEAVKVSVDARRLAEEVQIGRAQATRDSCQDQNGRNKNFKNTLSTLIETFPSGSRRRTRAEEEKAQTILLVDAIIPERDCEQRVAAVVGPKYVRPGK